MWKFICIPAILFATSLRGQTDDLFWFAAPEVSVDWTNFDVPIVLRITSYDLSADVTISQPAGGGMPDEFISLAANSSGTVDLTPWLNAIENTPANVILNRGLKITSTSKVTIYYEVVSSQCQCNPEIFVLKGRNALGQDFFIPMQNFLDNNAGYTPVPFSAFDIVATEDNTLVSITPSANIVGHPAGIQFDVILNEGQTYSATASSGLAAQHLMGSRVTSDKKIAITYKDDLLTGAPFGGCADLGGDQIVPVGILGTEYIAIRGFLNAPGDQLFIMATENATDISMNGIPLTTLNAGQTFTAAIGGVSAYIEATAPVSVLQLSGFGCEVGLDIIPPIVCTGSSSVSFTRSTVESLYITLLVEDGHQDDFLFNGNAGIITDAMFSVVPGTSGQWLVATTLFSLADTPLGTASLVSNTSGYFHMGFIHGGAGSGCRFGYFSNFANLEIEAHASSENICEGEDIELFCNEITDAVYSWEGPENFTSNLEDPVIENAGSLLSGEYAVTVTIPGCETEQDTVVIVIHEPSSHEIEVSLCPGESHQLPGGATVSEPGEYTDVLVNSVGCDSTITTIVELYNIDFNISENFEICAGQSAQFEVSGGIDYHWSPSDELDNPDIANPIASPNETTTYTVEITFDNGCEVESTVLVEVGELPFEMNTVDPICATFGTVEIVNPGGTGPYTYELGDNVQATALFENVSEGNYTVVVTDITGCFGEQNISLSNQDYAVEFESDVMDVICESPGSIEVIPGSNAVLPISFFVDNVEMDGYESDNLMPGSYGLMLVDGNGCQGFATAEIAAQYPEVALFTADPSFGEPPLEVQFSNVSIHLNEFYWEFGDGDFSSLVSPSHIFEYSGQYNITLFGADSIHGCLDSASMTIFVAIPFSFYVPNAFTPDGDGVNDIFRPMGMSFDHDHYELLIFDRWGEVIFTTNDYEEVWTGDVHNGDYFARDGVYNWLIKVRPLAGIEDVELSGTLLLMR